MSDNGGQLEGQPSYLTFNEENAKKALIDARGDVFVASQLLNITALRLSRAIDCSPLLQATREETKQAGRSVSDSEIERAIAERVGLYRVVGLDALHDLAAMPIDDNSAQNQVKLAAAARLVDGIGAHGASGELEGIFRELAQAYQQTAPRLRVIRERTTVEVASGERVVEPSGEE